MSDFFVNSENKEKNKKNATLSLLTTFLLIVTVIVFLFILIVSYFINDGFKSVREALNKFIVCAQSVETIKSSSNELTELARLFIVNHDERFAIAYLEEIESNQSQKRAFENLKSVCSDKDLALQRLKIAITQAESLTAMELYDMRLCYEILEKTEDEIPERIKAIEIKQADKKLSKAELEKVATKNIFGDGYIIYKIRVNENCILTADAISDEIKHELNESAGKLEQNLDRLRILIIILILINVLSTIGLKEFNSITKSYNELYEIGEKRNRILIQNAEYDALTGIFNRRAYEQICKASSDQKIPIALLLIDMDHFKEINDTYGHNGGDKALKALASILKDTFRGGDYISRIGGDEFTAILTDFKPEGFKIISEKIIYVNDRLSQINGLENVSISVGMAYSPVGYTEELYKQADKALYAVKESGRKGYRVYDKSLE